MKKDEFLMLLRQALSGDVPPGVIEENIRYYDSYISEEVRKGLTEEEVTAGIGDPRLIAKTIEETTDGASDGAYRDTVDDRSQSRSSYGQDSYEHSSYDTERRIHQIDLSKWYWKLLAALLVFGVIYLVFTIIGGIFMILSPLIGPLFLIWMVVWIFRTFHGRR